jgi:hypothetical protein
VPGAALGGGLGGLEDAGHRVSKVLNSHT